MAQKVRKRKKQNRSLTYEERERVLEKLNALKGSFASMLARCQNEVENGLPIEVLIYEVGGVFTKLHYIIHYCFIHGKLKEAEKLIAGLEFILRLFMEGDYNIRMLHDKFDCLVVNIFDAYPGLCFVFGDYKNCL